MPEKSRLAASSLLSKALSWVGLIAVASCGSAPSAGPSVNEGGAGGGTLDCAWAMGDNCWKSTVTAAKGCLPPTHQGAPPGKLSTDLMTCTYSSGETIAFAAPLRVHRLMLALPNFTLKSGGTTCLRFEAQTSANVVTTRAGGFTLSQDPGVKNPALTVTCPDGTRWLGMFSTLDPCETAALAIRVLPSGTDSDAGVFTGHIALDFQGTADGTTRIFDCETP